MPGNDKHESEQDEQDEQRRCSKEDAHRLEGASAERGHTVERSGRRFLTFGSIVDICSIVFLPRAGS